MENFIVSARKYRPDNFESVVGQGHITNTLRNALKTRELAHAFLFSGPRGVGKTTCARILARAINCDHPSAEGEPCNQCDSCTSFLENRSLNIHELDAASNNSVDDIRRIIEQVRYVPTGGKKAVFIIDEVHMLSTAAFNAFLKTLEEPPPHALFILATTERHKILPTILSRCQKFDFRRIKVDDMARHLENICKQEGIQYEFSGLQQISIKADGALRDALSIFDQVVSFSQKNVTFQVVLENLNILDFDYYFRTVDLMLAQDHVSMLLLLNEVVEKGFDVKDYLIGLNEHFRNLLICHSPETVKLLEASESVAKRYLDQVKVLKTRGTLLLNAFNLMSEAEQKIRMSTNPRFYCELNLIKLAYIQKALQVPAEEKKKSSPEPGLNEKPETPLEKAGNLTQPIQQNIVAEKPADPASKEVLSKPPPLPQRQKFSIPKNLNEAHTQAKSREIPTKAIEQDSQEDSVVDERISIDPETFTKALETVRERLMQTKPSVATILNQEWSLEFNFWIHYVFSDIQRKLLDEEKSIVQELREILALPALRLRIEQKEAEKSAKDKVPYTKEEKLKLLKEKNPGLMLLMKRFDTIVEH